MKHRADVLGRHRADVPGTHPPYSLSWNVLRGGCGVLLSSDMECGRPAGHENTPGVLHWAHDPSGSGSWVEYDDTGVVWAKGRGSREAPAVYLPRHSTDAKSWYT